MFRGGSARKILPALVMLALASGCAMCAKRNAIATARTMADGGDLDGALAVLDAELERKPTDTALLHVRAEILTDRAIFPDAYESYARYRAAGGKSDRALVARMAEGAVAAAMSDGSPDVRVGAALVLGSYRHPALLKYLAVGLEDKAVDVRLAAAEQIGRTPDAAGVELLKPALDDDDMRVRVEVARAMLGLGDLSGEGYLRTAATDGEATVAARAVETLATMGVKAGKKAVMAALTSKDAFTRARGVEALGAVKGPASAKLLKAACDDPDGSVRAEAIMAAVRRPDVKEFTAEIRRGLSDPEWLVRDAAATAVGRLADADMAETLREMVGSDSRIDVKFTAALALERVEDILGFEFIHRMLKSDNAAERRLAVIALGKLREGSKIKTLIGMLSDPEPPVRAATALALEKLDAEEAVDALAARVTDDAEDPDAKSAALHALSAILGADAEKRVLPGLADRNVLVRAHAGAGVIVARAGPVEELPASAPAEESADGG